MKQREFLFLLMNKLELQGQLRGVDTSAEKQGEYSHGAMTFSIMTHSIMTLSITTLNVMALYVMTLSTTIV